MENQKSTSSPVEESAAIELLKCARVKDGKKYINLYLRINGGNPIGIRLVTPNFKVKNLLLANAKACEIRFTTIVRDETERPF